MLGKIEGGRRGWQRMRWLNGITDSMDMSLCNSWSWWWTGGLASFSPWTWLSDWTDLNWDEQNCMIVWAFLGIAFLWDGNENWPFPVLWPPLFSKFAGIFSAAFFTASSFRIWNSSPGIPSPPLALFVVMLPKSHLTLHSRMSGSRWVITLSWLSGLWRSFLYCSSVYSCHLFLVSSASVRSILFLFFIEPIFVWNIPLVSLTFLKRSLVFPILLFSSISLHWSLKEGFLMSPSYCLELCIQMGISFLFSFAFRFSSIAICKASSDNRFAFFSFLFLWDGLDPSLLYNVMNLCPWFFRHSVCQI